MFSLRVRAPVLLLFAAFFSAGPQAVDASFLALVRDTISTSVPSAGADHVIDLTLVHGIPASGYLRIMPDSGAFDIPAAFSLTDADLAVATSGPYVDSTIAATASATAYGLSIVTGTSSSLLFELPSGESLPSGARLRVTLGAAAAFGGVGSTTILNPSSPGSYHVRFLTEDGSHAEIDYGSTVDAIVLPVSVSGKPIALAPVRYNVLPSGTLAAGSQTIEMSLQTTDYARCRYATTAGIPYASMTQSFNPAGLARTFWTDLTGMQDNTSYTFYIRCSSAQGVVNDDDYEVSFNLAPTPFSNTSVSGSGIIGRGGAGSYPNGSASLYLANVTLAGFTAPQSTVRIMQDGRLVKSLQAKSDGSFRGDISGLERGVYTFVVASLDVAHRQSGSVPTTLTLDQGTTNSVTDLILPPTFSAASSSVGVGADVRIGGYAVPNAAVDLRVDPPGGKTALHFAATSTVDGLWSIQIPGSALSRGTYRLLARVQMSEARISGYGSLYALGVGEVPSPISANGMRSDLNQDGKVNLVDFSILLTGWGADGLGDINRDSTTNLADFSIMLFDWTG